MPRRPSTATDPQSPIANHQSAILWHVNCGEGNRISLFMAAKVKIMKLLQEIRGLAQITSRRPQPKPPWLFLVQLRSHLNYTTTSRRRLVIPIDLQDPPDIPHPVKITHVNGFPAIELPVRVQ